LAGNGEIIISEGQKEVEPVLVKDCMTTQVISVTPETTVQEVVELFRRRKIYGVPVVDEEHKVVGIFTKSHLMDVLVNKVDLSQRVGEVMTRRVVTVGVNTSLEEVYRLAKEKTISRVPVVDARGKLVGLVTRTDLLDSLERDARRSLSFYKEELDRERDCKYTFDNIVGNSESIKWVKREARVAARTTSTILITGESGTGKEILAHAIHQASPRREGPFIKVNCAAVPENLLESELFGYDEGAFTGAKKGGRQGKFEQAQHGTVFLDEIGDMPLAMQSKLLRVLQEREIERVGGMETISVDVRVIAATNQELEKLVSTNIFREDLYYRLNVINIKLPPLRDRKEDIPLLVQQFLTELNREVGRKVLGVTAAGIELLMSHNWPGNIRELRNNLERAVVLSSNEVLTEEDFLLLAPPPIPLKSVPARGKSVKSLEAVVEEAEREAIQAALKISGNNKKRAAELLGIHRSLLYKKLDKLSIS